MAGKGSGVELGTAWYTITVDGSSLAGDLKKALGDAGKTAETESSKAGEKSGRAFGRKVEDAAKTAVKGAGVAVGGVLAAGVGTSVAKGLGRLKAIEEAQAKLKGLGNTSRDVADIMDNASAAVQGTAYGLGDAASVAASMVASGIKPGKELEQVLTTVADTSAIAGAQLNEMGLIFGSVAARGKLQGDDLMQLLGRGIPVLQILAEETGKTSAEVSDMVSKGEIDFETFATSMEHYLGGAAKNMGDTVSGATANFFAALGRVGETTLNSGFKFVPELLTNVTRGVDEFNRALKPAAEEMNRFTESIDIDPDMSVKFVQDLVDALDRFRNLDPVKDGIQVTGDALESLFEAGKAVIPVLVDLGAVAGKVGGATWVAFAKAVDILAQAFIAISPAIEAFADAVAALPAPVLAAVAGYAKFGDVLRGPVNKSIKGFVDSSKVMGGAMSGVIKYGADMERATGAYAGQLDGFTRKQARAAANIDVMRNGVKKLGSAIGGLAKTTAILAGVGLAIEGVTQAFQIRGDVEDWSNYIANGSDNARERVMDLGLAISTMSTESDEYLKTVSRSMGQAMDDLSTRADNAKNLWANVGQGFNKLFGGNDNDHEFTKMQRWAEDTEEGIKVLKAQFTDFELAKIVSGSDEEFDKATQSLDRLGFEGGKARTILEQLRAEFQQANAGGHAYWEVKKAIETLGNESSSTSEKVKALNLLLEGPSEGDKVRATAEAADTIRDLANEVGAFVEAGGLDRIYGEEGFNPDAEGATQFLDMMDRFQNSISTMQASGSSIDEVKDKWREGVQAMADASGKSFEEMSSIVAEHTGLTELSLERNDNNLKKSSDALAEFLSQTSGWQEKFAAGESLEVALDIRDPEPELIETLNTIAGVTAQWNQETGKLDIRVDDELAMTSVNNLLANVDAQIGATPIANIRADLDDGLVVSKFNDIEFRLSKINDSAMVVEARGENFESVEQGLEYIRSLGIDVDNNDPRIHAQLIGGDVVVAGLEDVIRSQSGVERDIPSVISAPGLPETKADVDAYGRSIKNIDTSWHTAITADGSQAIGEMKNVESQGWSLRDSLNRAFSGIKRIAFGGDYTSYAPGRPRLAGAGGMVLPAYASGGQIFDARWGDTLPGHGPWGSSIDNILAVSMQTGMPLALVNGKERVINTRSSYLYEKLLDLINMDHPSVRHLKKLAGGGQIGSYYGSGATANAIVDTLHENAGSIATMSAFQRSVSAFGEVVARYEQQEIKAERFERERQEKVKRETERLNEARQREQDRLSERYKDDRTSQAYQAQKKAIDKRYEDLITRLDPPDPRTAAEKRRDEERAAAKRDADIQKAVSSAIGKAGVTGAAAQEILDGVLKIDDKSARNFYETRRMDENVSKALDTTREAVIEAIRESSSGIAAAIDQAVAAWSGELVKIGEASRTAVLGDSGAFVDRMTGSVAAVTDAMVQRMMTGSVSAIMPAMLGGSSGLSIGQIKAAGGLENRWNMYANHQRGRARSLEDLARTEEGLAEVARLVLTGGATEATLRATARQYGLADPSKFLGEAFITGAEDYVTKLSGVIASELTRTPPGDEVVERLMAASAEFTANFEQDNLERLEKELEEFYKDSREQILRGMLTGDVSTISDELGQGMKAWSADVNSSIRSTMLDVRKGKRRNNFLEDAPQDLAEHMEMVQRGFAELLETGRVSADLITGLQLTPAEIKQYQQWGRDAQLYIGKSMGSRAQEIAQEIAEGISDKAASEWQTIIDDIASGFVRQVTTPVDEIFSLLGVEAPKLLTHDGLMEELKKADNWSEVSREYAVAGAEAARSSLSAAGGSYSPVFHIHGVTDPKAVADAVDKRLAAPGGRAGRMLGR